MNETNNDFEGQNESKGWFANVLSSVSTTFAKFIAIFKKNGLLYTILMMVLFIVFWSLIINPIRVNNIIEKRLEHQWEIEKEHVMSTKNDAEEKRYNADELITPIMDDIQRKFNLDRVLLMESHNNSTNISGVDFLFYSNTYESINLEDNSVDYIGDSFQRQYIHTLIGKELFLRLKHSNYLYYNDLNNYKRSKSRLLVKLGKFGANNALLIPIKNGKQQPVLLMVIANRDSVNSEQIYNYFKPFEKQIGQSLIN